MGLFGNKYKNKTDEALMEAFSRGKKEAFEVLYERYENKMLSFFYRMLGNDGEKSKDFLQDLFLKIIEKPGLFDTEKRFSTWIYSIAYNMCKNEYRKQSVRNSLKPENDNIIRDEAGKRIDESFFRTKLNEELKALSPEHRTVFILRYGDEKGIKEIAEILDCPAGTVKSRLYYAIRHLSGKLKIFEDNLINN